MVQCDGLLNHCITGIQLLVETLREDYPDIDLSRFYSVNVKADVVRRSQAAGVGRAQQTCACLFVDEHAAAVKSIGGFRFHMCLENKRKKTHVISQFVFADVFGGFETGARRLIQQIARLNLFAKSDSVGPLGTMLAFAASDYADRRGNDRATVTYKVLAQVANDVAGYCNMAAVPLCFPNHRLYNTMQFYAWLLTDNPGSLTLP